MIHVYNKNIYIFFIMFITQLVDFHQTPFLTAFGANRSRGEGERLNSVGANRRS